MTAISEGNYNLIDILSNNIEDLMYILDDSFKCEYVNKKVHLNSIGYSCLSESFIDYVYTPDRKMAIEFLKRILKSGKSVEEFRIKCNGNYKFFEIKGKRFVDKEYNAKIFLISKDISKLKQIESEWMKRNKKLKEITETLPEIRFWKLFQTKGLKNVMQKTREMLDLVIDNIPQYIYWKDTQLNYLGCNRNYALVNKLNDPNLIIGKNDSELPWLKDSSEHLKEREKHVIKNNKNEYSVESWNLADGHKAWFEVNRIPLHDLKDNVIGILATYNDITDRIISEQKLSESELKYRSILENIKEGYFEVDLKGNYTFFNNSFAHIFGYTETEILGSNYKKFADERNRKKVFKAFNQVYESGKGKKFLQFEFKKKNGELAIMETSVYLKYNSEGKKVGFYGIVYDITEKYHLEQKLKRSEEKYRLIFENAYDLITIIDHHLKFEFINEQPLFDILGYKKEEVINNSVLNIVHPSDKNLALKKLRKGLKKGEAQLQLRLKHKNDYWVWIEAKGKTFTDKDGNVKGIIVGRDVTQKKHAEEELKTLNKELERQVIERTRKFKESEEKFRTIAERSSMGILILQDGFIKYANDALSKITKYLPEELRNFSQSDLIKKIHPKDQALVLKHLQEKLDNKSKLATDYVFRIMTPHNNIKWIDLHSKLIEYQGKPAILATLLDVTEKRIAEENLKKSEEKFRVIAEQSYMGILIIQDYQIKYCNQKLADIIGYDKTEIESWKMKDLLKFVYKDDHKKFIQIVKNKYENKIGSIKNFQFKSVTKSNKIKWLEIDSRTIPYADGFADLTSVIDITKRKIAEEKLIESEKKLRAQNIELRELDRLKTDFITITAHELKTPLISVGGYIDLVLMRENELNPEIKEDLERSLANVRRLESYINRLTDVMKLDAKKLDLKIQESDIYDIIENSLSELHFQLDKKNLKLNLDVDKDIQLMVDPFRISQVFSNLISNAIKFSKKGGIIDISAKKQAKSYLFKVKDFGKGLKKEEIEKLFGKFVSVGQDSESFSTFEKGSGLGLYISKGIIETHGGKIGVNSEGLDKGAEFYFTLPIK